jgi:hypothetical protein
MKNNFLVRLIFIIGLSQCCMTVTAQAYVGKNKKETQLLLAKKSGLTPRLVYDSTGTCVREVYTAAQLSQCETILTKLTADTAYGWKRINENQIISKFALQLLVEVHEVKEGCRVQILQTAWTKDLYDLLLQQ